MGLKLSFTIFPPAPFHTVNFHTNRGIRQKWHLPIKTKKEISLLLSELRGNLKIITGLPDHFSIFVWPSKVHLLMAMNSFYKRNIHIYPDDNTHNTFILSELMKRDLFEQIVDHNRIDEIKTFNGKTAIYGQGTDLTTGRIINYPSLLSLKDMDPDINIFLDISFSFTNNDLNYKHIDCFVFSTDQVFGFLSGLTVTLIRNSVLEILLKDWAQLIHTDLQKEFNLNDQFIFCHREIDLHKLYIVKEICYDLIQRDITLIGNEIIYKSILLYEVLHKNSRFTLLVDTQTDRSKNVICARVPGSTDEYKKFFNQKGIMLDYIYSQKFGNIVRIGNFPVHSKEQVIYLADMIELI